MAFLDNSGDIILDAVLTDTGRLRLAQGDGSFKITKFALGDDEINYDLYNKNHSSGSAYYDLEILQTPILEAFTNNTSNLKTKLVTISRTNILYMPSLKLNKTIAKNPTSVNGGTTSEDPTQPGPSKTFSRSENTENSTGTDVTDDARFYIAVDKDTWNALFRYRKDASASGKGNSFDNNRTYGLIQGFIPGSGNATDSPGLQYDFIRVDQGLDTSQISPAVGLDSDLTETAFILETDYRLGRVKAPKVQTPTAVNFIDDDNIATYYLTASPYVNPTGHALPAASNAAETQSDLDVENPQVFNGPRGATLHFRLHASQELQQSTYLFTQIGDSEDSDKSGNLGGFPTSGADLLVAGKTTYYIDSTVRVIGANTGYRLDIPVRYIKIK
jgi:hypothetical protein